VLWDGTPVGAVTSGAPSPTLGAPIAMAYISPAVADEAAGDGGAGRLAVAAAEGRLGVSHSIIGRLREVGGTARLTSSPGSGTEVELRVGRT